MDEDHYCREIEAHLCRRNGGHLVRLVGPAFEMVRGWARQGVPLKVACQGIDRRIERLSAAGPRRRPVRIEFCEADVLDAFDAWRRAVGVHRADEEGGGDRDGAAGVETEAGESAEPARRPRARESLSTHVDRVIVRLTALRTGDASQEWDGALEDLVRRLDAIHPAARRARGEARDRVLAGLATLDAQLIDGARACAPPGLVDEVDREAEEELRPFGARLSPSMLAAARRRCADRILRERLRLPTLTVD
jgi:hypothetical protein